MAVLGLAVAHAPSQYRNPDCAASDVLTPINPGQPWPYVVGPNTTAHCLQDYRVYLPDPEQHPMPAEGWPVLVHLDLSGFTLTLDFPCLDPDAESPRFGGPSNFASHRLLGRILDAGLAVITARATPSTTLDTWRCNPPPTGIPGHGLFHPPGLSLLDPQGVRVVPYDRLDYPMAEKDAVMLVQHVRYEAQRSGGLLNMLDSERIGVHGVSAGAAALMWTAFGPEHGGTLPFSLGGGGQYDVSSHVDAAILSLGTVWYPLFDGNVVVPPGILHFADAGDTETNATSLGDVLIEELVGASALSYSTQADPKALDALPVYMSYGGEPFPCHDYTPHTSGCPPGLPFCFGCEDMAQTTHPAWSGFVWKTEHPLNTRLVVTDCLTFAEKSDTSAGGAQVPTRLLPVERDPLDDQQLAQLHDDMVSWLLHALGDPMPPSAWFPYDETVVVGQSSCSPVFVPDAISSPTLSALGVPQALAPVSILIEGAEPDAAAYLFSGQADGGTFFKGGVSIPVSPLSVLQLRGVDGTGSLTLSGLWPPGIMPGQPLYLQVWTSDSAAAAGFASSNVLLVLPL